MVLSEGIFCRSLQTDNQRTGESVNCNYGIYEHASSPLILDQWGKRVREALPDNKGGRGGYMTQRGGRGTIGGREKFIAFVRERENPSVGRAVSALQGP